MLDLILSWLAKVLAAAIDLAIKTILPVFGFDFTTFSNAFPFAATAYFIFQRVALAITLIVAVYHLIPFLMSWFGIRSEQLKATPFKQLGQAVLAVIAIYYGNYILGTIIDIAQLPFSALLEADAVDLSMDFEYGIAQGISDIFYQQSILLYIILIVMIGWSMIKVILEAVERYIVLYVLVYLSPLAAASLASEETSGIYKRFFSMFISQCLLLLLNVWSLKMGVSMFNSLSTHSSPILGLLMGYAFLRIAQKLDSYMNQLGLNAAITGAGLGNEMFATGAVLMGKFSGMTGGRSVATSGAGGGGGILGFSQKVSQSFGRYNPVSAGADIVRGAASGFSQTVSDAATAGTEAYSGGTGTPSDRISSAIKEGKAHLTKENLQQNVRSKVDGVDNIITRKGNEHRTDDAIYAMANAESGKGQEGADPSLIAANAYSAGRAFSSFHQNDYTTHEQSDVAAVLDGIGAAKVDSTMAQFVNVGYGNIPAKNVEYSMDRSGINASFALDGRKYNLNVVNADQFNEMHHDEQIAYQSFSSKAGQVYHYKATSQKVESTGKPNPK